MIQQQNNMTIQWNTVTWYSKLIAVILFVITFAFAFYMGTQYEMVWQMKDAEYGTDSGGGEYGEIPDTTGTDVSVIATSSNVMLRPGQKGIVNGMQITLNSVLNDYRCPIDVQCIQAGAINTNVTFVLGSTTKIFNMPSDEVPQEFEGYHISIVAVEPPAHSKKTIAQSEYRVTFHVEEK